MDPFTQLVMGIQNALSSLVSTIQTLLTQSNAHEQRITQLESRVKELVDAIATGLDVPPVP